MASYGFLQPIIMNNNIQLSNINLMGLRKIRRNTPTCPLGISNNISLKNYVNTFKNQLKHERRHPVQEMRSHLEEEEIIEKADSCWNWIVETLHVELILRILNHGNSPHGTLLVVNIFHCLIFTNPKESFYLIVELTNQTYTSTNPHTN